MKNGHVENYFPGERSIAYLPVLGAAIALTFDVGCFYAIGISFFTMFSLSEHLLFAIQALPIVIVLLFVFVMMLPIITRETVPPSPADHKKLSTSQNLVVYVALVALLLALLVSLIAFAAFGLSDLYTNTPEALLIIVVAAGCAIGFFLAPPHLRRTVIILIAMLMSLTVSFVFGFTSGRTYFGAESPNIIKLKSGPPISGRIIRSGDRGVLFYDPAEKQIRFELWDAITSIELRAGKRTP